MSNDNTKRAELSAARARIAEQDAKIEELRSEIRFDGFINANRHAADQHRLNQQPLTPLIEHEGYIRECAKAMPEHAWRWLQHHDMVPTVDELCESFSVEERHTIEGCRRVLAVALDDPAIPVYLAEYASDFYVEVDDDDAVQQRMSDLFDRYERRDDALHDAYEFAQMGDPDPFGLTEETETQ